MQMISVGNVSDTTRYEALIEFLSNDENVKALCKKPMPQEYSYASLSTMLLDAIFSIGVRYRQVQKVVARHAQVQKYDPFACGSIDPYPLQKLIGEGRLAEKFAETLRNRGLTSSRSGILKAEAVVLAAKVLVKHRIVDFSAWRSADDATLAAVENEFRKIKGQRSGVSWSYLSMLAGDETRVKTDRMVLRYVEAALGRQDLSPKEAGALLLAAAAAIRGLNGYPSTLTARQLDWAVWTVARTHGLRQAPPRVRSSKATNCILLT